MFLNRMHVAAKCDSLGALLILVGCMILGGFSFYDFKIVIGSSDSMDNKSGCGSPDCKSRSKTQDEDESDEYEVIGK